MLLCHTYDNGKFAIGLVHLFLLLLLFTNYFTWFFAGFAYLDFEELDISGDMQPTTNAPDAPSKNYETTHGVSNGRRGGNCNGPQFVHHVVRGGRNTGRIPG